MPDSIAAGRSWHVERGNVLDVLRTLADGCVQTCVTSPPFFNLRAYGTEPQVWGPDDCRHEWIGPVIVHRRGHAGEHATAGNTIKEVAPRQANLGQTCVRCSAWRGELGSEPSVDSGSWARGERPVPGYYIDHLRMIFAELYRVMRDDSTVWCDIGDSYAGSGKGQGGKGTTSVKQLTNIGSYHGVSGDVSGIPAGNLLGVPQRLMLALQADGWVVRRDIVWCKRAPMPESTRNRPTTAHEYVLLLSKRGSGYFYDQDACRVPHARWWDERNGGSWAHATRSDKDALVKGKAGVHRGNGYPLPHPAGRNLWSFWDDLGASRVDYDYCRHCDHLYEGREQRHIATERADGMVIRTCPRCRRSDGWVAHYAAYPVSLPLRCIKLSTSEKGHCPKCGAGWRRVTKKRLQPQYESRHGGYTARGNRDGMVDLSRSWKPGSLDLATTGWQPGCDCPDVTEADLVPAVVLDPFSGTGTTGLAALRLGQRYLGIELSGGYAALSRARLRRAVGVRPDEAKPTVQPQQVRLPI